MSVVSIADLKTKWVTGYVPTQADYVDLFDTLSNLAVILGASNKVGGNAIVSDNEKSSVNIYDAELSSTFTDGDVVAQIIKTVEYLNSSWTDGTNGGSIDVNAIRMLMTHTVAAVFNSPTLSWTQKVGLGNQFLYIDDNGDFQTYAKPGTYKVILSQNLGLLTKPIVINVLENTLGGAVAWSRIGVGSFRGFKSGAFVANKTFMSGVVTAMPAYGTSIPVVDATGILKGNIIIAIPDPDYILVNVFDETGAPAELGTLIGSVTGQFALPAIEVFP